MQKGYKEGKNIKREFGRNGYRRSRRQAKTERI